MRFKDVRDQDAAVGTLGRAMRSGKVPHAYLFSGPAGVGKKMSALALACAMNCEEMGEDACGVCGSCKKVDRGIHPDVRVLSTPEGKRRIPIENVREAERWLAVSPHEGRSKVLVIDPADLMSASAANALLKTLEEPRSGSFIVLVTSSPSSLLPTVRSRCQSVRFRALGEATVQELLVEEGMDPEKARLVSSLAQGSMEKAAGYAEEEMESRLDIVGSLLSAAVDNTPASAMGAAAELRGDRDGTAAVLELAVIVLEELMWLATGPGAVTDRPLTRKVLEREPALATGVTPREISGWIAACNKAMSSMMRNNMNPQLALEGFVTALRGCTDAGESWLRIGAR